MGKLLKSIIISAVIISFPFTAAMAAEVIKIGGTGSGLGVMQLLGDAYSSKNPGTKVEVMPNLGSAGGIRGVGKGVLDIGISSRPLSDDEKVYRLSLTEYARTPFVVIVRQDAAVSEIKTEDLVKIFEGKKQKWPNGIRIRPVVRPAADYDNQIAKAISPEMSEAVDILMSRRGMLKAVTDQDTANTVETTPGAIGFSTLGQVITEKLQLKVLSLDGVPPNLKNLTNGTYKPYKVLGLVTGPQASSKVKKFLGFIAAPAGRKIFEESGYIVTLKETGR